jgi:ATP-dependent helicase/nuclease subunit A
VGSKLASQRVGTLIHRLLEQWDFQLESDNFLEPLRECCRRDFPEELDEGDQQAILLDLEQLMETFLRSPAYQELQQATILGREVPFIVPWSTEESGNVVSCPCVMEGVMDVVYEVAGDVWVGDYKTDRVTASNVVEYAEVYREQAQVYALAASRSLGLNVKGCKLFFLRIGEAVTFMRDVAKL